MIHAIGLSSGAEVAVGADEPMVMASVFKAIVALEFYAQVAAKEIDPARPVEITARDALPGPTGISNFLDPARISLRDLVRLMMTISDNAATEIISRTVGLSRVNARARTCGCHATEIVDLRAVLDSVAMDMGFSAYLELVDAQAGRLGGAAQARSVDQARLDTVAALDPLRTCKTTARDMTTFLAAVWADSGASMEACASLRDVMAQQVTRRLEPALLEGGALAAKSGGLFGRLRNEIGVITDPDGQAFAVAVFTRAYQPFVAAAAINSEIGRAARSAVTALRRAER